MIRLIKIIKKSFTLIRTNINKKPVHKGTGSPGGVMRVYNRRALNINNHIHRQEALVALVVPSLVSQQLQLQL